jgi:hypothetical protein
MGDTQSRNTRHYAQNAKRSAFRWVYIIRIRNVCGRNPSGGEPFLEKIVGDRGGPTGAGRGPTGVDVCFQVTQFMPSRDAKNHPKAYPLLVDREVTAGREQHHLMLWPEMPSGVSKFTPALK